MALKTLDCIGAARKTIKFTTRPAGIDLELSLEENFEKLQKVPALIRVS